MARIKALPPRQSLVDRVVNHIQSEITEDRLRANQKVSESEIARRLKISRSPIREALRVLERDGLIRLVPGKGAHVVEVTPEDACEIFLLRSYLIGLAVRLATPGLTAKEIWKYKRWIKDLEHAAGRSDPGGFLKITSAIERFFTHHCGSERLTRFVEMLGNPCLKYRAFLASVPGYMGEVVTFHAGIARAIEEKNPDQAESLRRAISEKGRLLIHQYFLNHQHKNREHKMLA
jgi:DNA-binding GntR family transcriptional regulator